MNPLRFVLRGLRDAWALTLVVTVALAAWIGVWVGLPLYAESASARLLATEVNDAAGEGVPFGYLFSYNRLSGGDKPYGDFVALNELLDGESSPFGATVLAKQRTFTTVPFELQTDGGTEGSAFASLSSFGELATIVNGRMAQPAASPLVGPIEVVLDVAYAAELDVVVGETIAATNRRVELDDPRRSLEVTVVGLWEPAAAPAPGTPVDPLRRFLRTGTLERRMVVPEATLAQTIDLLTDASVTNGQWLALLDSTTLTTDGVQALLADTERINREVDDRLRGARLLVSPESSLETFQSDVARLNRGLRLFSLPTVALTLAVAVLLLSIRWQRRQSTVLMLRRRGVSAGTIIGQTALEAALMTAGAAVLGVFIARIVAGFMGRTTTFLRLGTDADLGLVMNSRSWTALVVGVLVSAALVVAPSLSLLRSDIGTGKTRDSLRRPWFQRAKLDLVIIGVVAFFSWFVLRRTNLSGQLLDDPIVILVPAATAFIVGLAVLRSVPWLAGQVGRLLDRSSSTAGLLVARRAERQPAAMAAPLLLLVITAAVAVYTGSLARTLDLQLFDTAFHQTGATNRAESRSGQATTNLYEIVNGETEATSVAAAPIDPIGFERIWGVEAASRIGRAPGRLQPPTGAAVPATFIGVDTTTFADIAFWRSDFSASSLPELMARLDATTDSVLVTNEVLDEADLAVGDIVEVRVRLDARNVTTDMVIVGTFDQFPTWIPGEESPPVVASLSAFESRSPAPIPQELLFEASTDGQDLAQTRADLNRVGIDSRAPRSAEVLAARAQGQPDRQGVFGLLTVGFALSAALTIIGFVFYAVFGFTRQLTELGVLRAFGLPVRTLSAIVALDLLVLGVVGVGAGTATGLAMARWYLPQLVDNPTGSAPTMLSEIDWGAALGISAALAAALGVVTMVLLLVLRRLKLFTAVKFDQGVAE